MIVYVATAPTYYEIVAVSIDEDMAIRLAGEKAFEYLKDRNAIFEGETDTVEGVIENFGIFATRVELESAEFVGN